MLDNHELPYVGRFACDWLDLQPQTRTQSTWPLYARSSRRNRAEGLCSPIRNTSPGSEAVLDFAEDRHRTRVDTGVRRHVERDEVADDGEVEELGEVALSVRFHLDDVWCDLVDG